MEHALLLAGGQGRRFWPRSRRARPKQFMSFDGRRSLLRTTAERLAPVVPFERQWVVTHHDYVDAVRHALPEVPAAHVIGEPRGLNTAPAIGVAAALMRAEDPAAVMVVQAADHWIADVARFRALVRASFAIVAKRRTALLVGFRPTRPATGYGYIGTGRKLAAPRGMMLREVRSYREKPSAAVARRLVAAGHLWNGCMFFWHADTILAGIREHLPRLGRRLEAAGRATASPAWLAAAYRGLEPVSIEHGVVERLPGMVVLEGDCGWEDVGTWNSLAGLLPADAAGNAVQGMHLGIDTERSIVLSDSGIVVTLGVSDLIVVRDGDAVLVLPRSRESDMREVVAALEKRPRLRRFV